MPFGFKTKSRSSSHSPKRNSDTMEDYFLPPLPKNPPPFLSTSVPTPSFPPPPPIPSHPTQTTGRTLLTSDEPFSTYGEKEFAPTTAIIKDEETANIYAVTKGPKLGNFEQDRLMGAASLNTAHYIDQEKVKSSATPATVASLTGTRPKNNTAVYEKIQENLLKEENTLENMQKEITRLQAKGVQDRKEIGKLQFFAQATTDKVKEHNDTLDTLQQDMEDTDGDLRRLVKDVSENHHDITELRSTSSRRSSRSSSRMSSRANSRPPSPTSDILVGTSAKLHRHQQELAELEQQKQKVQQELDMERYKPTVPIIQSNYAPKEKTYNSVADLIHNKAVWNSLESLKEDKLERYQQWYKTFSYDYKSFKLPPELQVEAALRKVPTELRQAAMDRDIVTETDLRKFLHENIFGGRSVEYAKEKFNEINKMGPNDSNYPEVLRTIQTEQVPVLMSLQEDLIDLPEETLKVIRDKETLELFKAAIQTTVNAVARNKGMAGNYKDLFRSCNDAASAKLLLAASGKKVSESSKQIAGVEVQANGLDVTSNDPPSREQELMAKIKKLENALSKKKGLPPNQPRYQNDNVKRWCYYHKSGGHYSKDCRQLLNNKIPEDNANGQRATPPPQQNKYMWTDNGKKCWCGHCVPNKKVLYNLCNHCWRHSDPARAINREDCLKCKFNKRISDRPAAPPPQTSTQKDGT